MFFWFEFFVPIMVFFRPMPPHAVIPTSHLFVGRQEVRIGVTVIIQPSSTPPCRFSFFSSFNFGQGQGLLTSESDSYGI